MAKAKKYELSFIALDNTNCRVDFFFEGYVGSVIELDGSSKPFVLREFNSEENLFKPIRPLLAEIEIVTNSSGVTVDNFLSAADTDIEVRFYCHNMSTPYWSGFVLQDDFQESYENANHILKITASEALGSLKDKPLANNGLEVYTKVTPLALIEYCLQNSSKPLTDYFIFNNLYHTSMLTTTSSTALNQAKIDPRTFEKAPREFEDSYTVLSKINTAFNQTIFQYEDKWFVLRLEELYQSGLIRGYQTVGGVFTALNKRFDIEVGVNSEIKPIAPQMLRKINRKPKETIVTFNYERLEEVIKNSSFSRGSLISTYPTFKDYSIEYWTLYAGDMTTETLATFATSFRRETYLSNTGPLLENYIQVPIDVRVNPQDLMLKCESINVNFGEKIKFSFDVKFNIKYVDNSLIRLAYVKLIGLTGTYTLNEEGLWVQYGVSGYTAVHLLYLDADNIISDQWNTVEVEADPLPDSGTLVFYFICSNYQWNNNQYANYKNFEFEILNRLDGFNVGLTAFESKFIKPDNIKFNNNYDIYLSDFMSESYKGLIYQSDSVTPTDFEWYRYRFSGERHSFKKQNTIAYWSHNRYDRDIIDAAFYGLKWDDAGTTRVIGLPNTIKLVNDAPNKIYYISNLREIDFYRATWNVTMEEVWDENRDGATGITRSLSLNVVAATYANQSTVPFSASTNPDFVVTGDNKIIYIGAQPITETITISLSGNFIATTGAFPVNTTFLVKQNTTTIKTQNFPVSINPQPFSFNLSPAGTITINPNDEFQITYSAEVGKSINSIQFTSGSFQVSTYDVSNILDYDDYIEKYIYK